MVIILVLFPAASAGNATSTLGLAGHYQCGFTDYMWPSAPDDSPTATGGGTMEFESDSDGKILSGTMTQHEADDTRRFGEKACTFNLVGGQSVMTSLSSGTATFTWQLKPGSDSHCGAWIRNTANLGLTESVRDYLTFTTTSQFFVENDGSSRSVSASPTGVSICACRPIR